MRFKWKYFWSSKAGSIIKSWTWEEKTSFPEMTVALPRGIKTSDNAEVFAHFPQIHSLSEYWNTGFEVS
jgi:hypothetical protein